MQSKNIPYRKGMNYGMGVNILTGEIAGNGVDEGAITHPSKAGGQSASYKVTLIQSYEDLYKSIGISVEASGHYGLFSAEGKFQFANETKFNSQSTFLLARVVVENPFYQCEDAKIKSAAADLIRNGKMDIFRERCGDGFVRGIQTGGEYFSLIEITSTRREVQEQVGVAIQAQYQAFLYGVSANSNIDIKSTDVSEKFKLQVITYQRGGAGEGVSYTGDVSAVLKRLHDFPALVEKNPVPYLVQIASYNTLDLPPGPNIIDLQNKKEVLEDCARTRLRLMTLRNDIEFVRQNPDYFIDPPNMAKLNAWHKAVTEQINDLTKHASRCANQVMDCSFFTASLPADLILPERQAQAPQPQMVKTPYLVGLALGTAKQQLQNLGLVPQLQANKVSEQEKNINKVLQQVPPPQTELKIGTAVTLIFNAPASAFLKNKYVELMTTETIKNPNLKYLFGDKK